MSRSAQRESGAREAWELLSSLVLDNERRREVVETVGISFARLRALRRIAAGPKRMCELASELVLDPPNLTPIVNDLERLGLVERRAHPSDRRVKLVSVTEKGAAMAHQADEILSRPPASLDNLSPDDLEDLLRILRKVRGDLVALER